MSQLRMNPLTGRWVTIAVERSDRPEAFATRSLPVQTDTSLPCPFCPGHEETLPPALETYGPEGGWLVRVVPNRYPAFAGTEPLTVEQVGAVFSQAPGSGLHEVLVLSPDHDTSWADLSDKQAGLVMAAIRDRVEDQARSSIIRYTQAIVNHGREAGASIEHPHGQLLGIPFVPGEILDEEAGFRRHRGECLLCATVAEECDTTTRVVAEEEGVVVVCPFWSASPYEMLLVPRRHVTHVHRAEPADVVAIGHALRNALRLLRDVLGDVAYNLVFHTAPHSHDVDPFHWHVHVLPKVVTVAGFELGTGVMVNVVPPEQAARDLRSA